MDFLGGAILLSSSQAASFASGSGDGLAVSLAFRGLFCRAEAWRVRLRRDRLTTETSRKARGQARAPTRANRNSETSGGACRKRVQVSATIGLLPASLTAVLGRTSAARTLEILDRNAPTYIRMCLTSGCPETVASGVTKVDTS
jgi:hypothetical protein